MSLNLAIVLTENAARQPDHAAIVIGDKRLTYADLNGAANKVANALRSLGVRSGDAVAVMLPSIPEFAIVYYGILKLGAVVVPIDMLLAASPIAAVLQESDALAFFTWEKTTGEAARGFVQARTCRHLIIVNSPGSDVLPEGAISLNAMLAIGSSSFDTACTMPDDCAAIVCHGAANAAPLSAPGGDLLGAELTHFNLFYNAAVLADRVVALAPDTVALAALPSCDPFAQTCTMNAVLYAGGTMCMAPPPAANGIMHAIKRHRVTYLVGRASLFRALLDQPGGHESLTTLKACLVCGLPVVDSGLLDAWQSAVHAPLLQAYGLPETSPVITVNPPSSPRPGSVGLPIWGVEVRVWDSDGRVAAPGEAGEVVVRGHNVMKGYHGRPEASADVLRNGWFLTGDTGRLDADGYLFIVDFSNAPCGGESYGL